MSTEELLAAYLYHAGAMLDALEQRIAAGELHYSETFRRLAEAVRNGGSEEIHEALCHASVETAANGDLLLMSAPRSRTVICPPQNSTTQ